MTGITPDGQGARETFSAPFDPDESEEERWEAVAYAGAAPYRARIAELESLLADAVTPTAADFDEAAAEIRLRDLAAQWDDSAALAERHRDDAGDDDAAIRWEVRAALYRHHAAELRERAGLDA